LGLCYTRTGRQFFDNQALEQELIERLGAACDASGIWEELRTDWLCLDAELMPWSAKAQGLLREQYAPVGLAAQTALNTASTRLAQAATNGVDVGALLETFHERSLLATQYVEAYRRYCWPVRSLDDVRLAPFHILAGEGHVYVDRDHLWHMEQIGKLCVAGASADAPLFATSFQVVDVTDRMSEEQGTLWWEELTARGGEGMVVKPFDFIYGPEYTLPEHLDRLRKRGLSAKRSLALREFALGIEGLERFVRNEPLRRVHECVFGVLALESEPVDPRL
jgi:protein phosphatase